MSEGLTIAAERAVIARQIEAWQEKRFDVQIAHKVHTSLKSPQAALDALVAELTVCEKALALLAQELETRKD